MLGPTFLKDFTVTISGPIDLKSNLWRRQLKTPSGQTKFRIKYYGQFQNQNSNIIVGTDFAPLKVFAIDVNSEQEILLFDGCKHGYNAMFCDTFAPAQIENRTANRIYKDRRGNEIFELVILIYNRISYDEEFSEEVDDNGLIEIMDGSKMSFDIVKRDGFDAIQIWGINEEREKVEIVSEELA